MVSRNFFLLYVCFMCGYSLVLAQQSINSSNQEATVNGFDINISLGQLFYHSSEIDDFVVFPGIHHPDFHAKILGTKKISKRISAFPNPFHDTLIISSYDEIDSSYALSIIDFQGREIYNGLYTNQRMEINLTHLPVGVYLLLIENQVGLECLSFKIFKK